MAENDDNRYRVKIEEHRSYESISYVAPEWWNKRMDTVVCRYAGALDDDFDIDAFKKFLLVLMNDPGWNPDPDHARILTAKMGSTAAQMKAIKSDYSDRSNDIMVNLRSFDVLQLQRVLRQGSRSKEQRKLLDRFDKTKLAGKEKFNLNTFHDTSEWVIWFDKKAHMYRDIVSGDTTGLGYCEKIEKDTHMEYVQHFRLLGEGDSYARDRAMDERALMVAAMGLNGRAWFPSTPDGNCKGLDPLWVLEAGICFLNENTHAVKKGSEKTESSDESSSEEDTPSAAKKPRGAGKGLAEKVGKMSIR